MCSDGAASIQSEGVLAAPHAHAIAHVVVGYCRCVTVHRWRQRGLDCHVAATQGGSDQGAAPVVLPQLGLSCLQLVEQLLVLALQQLQLCIQQRCLLAGGEALQGRGCMSLG